MNLAKILKDACRDQERFSGILDSIPGWFESGELDDAVLGAVAHTFGRDWARYRNGITKVAEALDKARGQPILIMYDVERPTGPMRTYGLAVYADWSVRFSPEKEDEELCQEVGDIDMYVLEREELQTHPGCFTMRFELAEERYILGHSPDDHTWDLFRMLAAPQWNLPFSVFRNARAGAERDYVDKPVSGFQYAFQMDIGDQAVYGQTDFRGAEGVGELWDLTIHNQHPEINVREVLERLG